MECGNSCLWRRDFPDGLSSKVRETRREEVTEEETHVPASPPPALRTCQASSLVSARARGGNAVSETASGQTSSPDVHSAGAPSKQVLVVPSLMSRPLQDAGFPPGQRAGAARPDTRNRHKFRPPPTRPRSAVPTASQPPPPPCGLSVSNVTIGGQELPGASQPHGVCGPDTPGPLPVHPWCCPRRDG